MGADCPCRPVVELRGDLEKVEIKRISDIEMMRVERANDLEHAREINRQMAECLKTMQAGAASLQDSNAAIKEQNRRLNEGNDRFQRIEKVIEKHISGKDGEHQDINVGMWALAGCISVTWLFLSAAFGPRFIGYVSRFLPG